MYGLKAGVSEWVDGVDLSTRFSYVRSGEKRGRKSRLGRDRSIGRRGGAGLISTGWTGRSSKGLERNPTVLKVTTYNSRRLRSAKNEVVKGDGYRERPYGQGMRVIARWERR